MSRAARGYYRERATRLGVSKLPELLYGLPRQIIHEEENFASLGAETVAKRFRDTIHGVAAFAVHGVFLNFPEARGNKPDHRAFSQAEYAAKLAAWALASRVAPSGSSFYAEAIAYDEVPRVTFRAAIINHPSIYERDLYEQEQVYILSRWVEPGQELRHAYLTVVHGDYHRTRPERRPDHLTPRYFGSQVVRHELAGLPPLPQEE